MANLTPQKIAAIVLAAGSSSRMGRPKQLLKIDGESLVRRSARAAMEADCAPVIVVTGSGSERVMAEFDQLPVHFIFNPEWETGMGSSIRIGIDELMRLHPNIEGTAILVCDQPRLNGRMLQRLFETWRTEGTPMAACEYSGTLGPPCCFGRAKLKELVSLKDHEGAKQVLLSNPSEVAKFPWPDGSIDLDTEQDLQAFQGSHPLSTMNTGKSMDIGKSLVETKKMC